tara:strand:- start:23827 stop:23985 length:159 start_codon:yes stop_codon:yes gene_type:complete
MKKNPQMYSLKYYSGQRLIETVMHSKPLALVKWKKRDCLSAYRSGDLRIEKI